MILGITGGTGCGKTTLLQLIGDQGGMVLDCDAIYHQLLSTDAQLLSQIEARFPGTVENGILQRKKLGNLVFSDSSALEDLNKITHSAVVSQVRRSLASKPSLAAIDAIALIESGVGETCSAVVGILAPKEVRIRRIMAREGISEEYARKRVEAQQGDEFFRTHCTHILENGEGSPEEFGDRARKLFQLLIR